MTSTPHGLEAALDAFPHHTGIVVEDIDAQARWYERAFGMFEISRHSPDPGVDTVLLATASGLRIELVRCAGSKRLRTYADPREAATSQGLHHWAVEVADVAVAFERLISVGARAGVEPNSGPRGSTFAYVSDPEGNPIELVQSSSELRG